MTWLTQRREFEPAVELCRLFPVIPDFFAKTLTNEIKNGNILSVVTETVPRLRMWRNGRRTRLKILRG